MNDSTNIMFTFQTWDRKPDDETESDNNNTAFPA